MERPGTGGLFAAIEGTVVRGNRLGCTLGFPTANIAVSESLDMRDGVYAVRAEVDGQKYEGMANIGRRPSVGGGGERVLEVNLFGFDRDIYGRTVRVEPLWFVRPEEKFATLDELKAAVEGDRLRIVEYFKHQDNVH